MKINKSILAGIAIASILITFTVVKLMSNKKTVEEKVYIPDVDAPVLVEVVNPTMHTFEDEFSYLGTFEPYRQNLIGAEGNGRVISMNVSEGDQVGQGSVIAKLDDEMIKLQIENSEPSSYVILNFARPNDVNIQIEEAKKFVLPHFKKNMKKFGMVGWGLGTKITPQGKEYSSMMTWDSYDSLENVMKHLGGYGVIEGLPFDKFSEIIEWENRYIMKVISSTTN